MSDIGPFACHPHGIKDWQSRLWRNVIPAIHERTPIDSLGWQGPAASRPTIRSLDIDRKQLQRLAMKAINLLHGFIEHVAQPRELRPRKSQMLVVRQFASRPRIFTGDNPAGDHVAIHRAQLQKRPQLRFQALMNGRDSSSRSIRYELK